MKLLTVALLMALPINALAINAILNCASSNIPTTYSTSSPSLPTALKGFGVPSKASLAVINNTAGRICVNTITPSSTVAPTAGNNKEHCVAPQMFAFYDLIDMPTLKGNVYVRADVATCTTGTVDIDVW